MDKVKETVKQLYEKLSKDKKALLLFILGISVLLIITLPGIFNSSDKSETQAYSEVSREDYALETEKRLTELISSIDGAGKTKVMVTLENTEEKVYARDIKGESSEYVLVKAEKDENGLLISEAQPKIRGVAVVCSGGENARVKRDIINTVCSVMGIYSSRVSIAKMTDTE